MRSVVSIQHLTIYHDQHWLKFDDSLSAWPQASHFTSVIPFTLSLKWECYWKLNLFHPIKWDNMCKKISKSIKVLLQDCLEVETQPWTSDPNKSEQPCVYGSLLRKGRIKAEDLVFISFPIYIFYLYCLTQSLVSLSVMSSQSKSSTSFNTWSPNS